MLVYLFPKSKEWPKNKKKLFRYVYVCFAADLAAAGNKTLHILVIIFVVTFSLQWIIIYPILGKYLI